VKIWTRIKAFVVWLVARVVLATIRVRNLYLDRLSQARELGRPILYAFWHGRQLALFKANPEAVLTVMTSLSRDGEMQASICRRFGLRVVRGSSSRRGFSGLMALGRRLKEGISVGMAVDGPRGPAFEAKSGIVVLARRSGSPIVPITASFGRSVQLRKAWDRFLIPLPFSRATVAYGEPILVSKQATSQQMREATAQLTASLQALTAEVDAQGRRR
jgi:lysophospholipid acyltransferase (LPLAT)-like uncharacterized protein